jgi:protein gp37
VWLGVSVEDQEHADARIPHLLSHAGGGAVPVCEPLLGPVNLEDLGQINLEGDRRAAG